MTGDRGTPWWRRPLWMSRQSWVAIVAAVGFLGCVVLVSFVPVPYVTWAPGETVNTLGVAADGTPEVQVSGVPTYPTTGRLDLTTVSVTRVDSRIGLVEALLAWARPGHDTLDRDLYYPPGTTEQQSEQELAEMMSTSQLTAAAAAARAAGLPVTARPVISAVVINGPAYGRLRPGDVVLRVGGQSVVTTADVDAALTDSAARDTEPVVWQVRRDGHDIRVTTGFRDGETPRDAVGVDLIDGWDLPLQVRFAIPDEIGGPSAGLVFSLAIYDRITPGDLLGGSHVAGTGTIDATGTVGAIGGIQSKIAGADAAGATVFLVPAPNCADLAGVRAGLRLVRVATLAEAITVLKSLRSNPDAEVPTC